MKKMNIATAANGEYVKYLVVMLKSLFINNTEFEVVVYLLNSGFQDSEKQLLVGICEKNNVKINYLEVDDTMFEGVDKTEFTIETYFRLMMFDLLPNDLDRLLYLDVDIIINQSLESFYFSDFEDNYLIACSHRMTKDKVLQGVQNGTINPARGECFNAGVVLYNVSLMGKKYSFQYFKNVMQNIDYYYDQGILNYVFWDKTKYVDTCIFNNRGYDEVNINDIVIMHFASDNPWDLIMSQKEIEYIDTIEILETKRKNTFNIFYMDMVKVWWVYASKTNVFNLLKNEERIKHDFYLKRIIPTYLLDMNKKLCRLKGIELLIDAVLEYGSITNVFIKHGITSCALYGMGKVGRYVLKDLIEHDFLVEYYIDRKQYSEISIPYKSINEIQKIESTLVICVMYDSDKIKQQLQNKTNGKVILLADLLVNE